MSGTAHAAAGRHVLAIQDTTELNYQAHAERVSGLGSVGNGVDVGLFLHPLLALDAADGSCLGLAHLHYWMRTQKALANYRKRPIEDKESYRWLQAAQAGQKVLSQARLAAIVADRESDIYEEWARLPDVRTHLLTRSCRDRALVNADTTLYPWLEGLPAQGSYSFAVPTWRNWKSVSGVSPSGARTVARTKPRRRKSRSTPLRSRSCRQALWGRKSPSTGVC